MKGFVLNWPLATTFCVVSVILGGLVYKQILPPSAFLSLIAMLIPSPFQSAKED